MSILFKLPAIKKDSNRRMIEGAYEKDKIEAMDIGDMITSQSSGGNSTDAFPEPAKDVPRKEKDQLAIIIIEI